MLGHAVGRDEIDRQLHIRVLQTDDERRGVGRADAERRGGFAAEAHVHRTDDGVEARGLRGAGFRLQVASQRIDEITGREWLAIGPTEVAPQPKSPGESIGTRRPRLGTARYYPSCGIGDGETGEELSGHLRSDLAGGALRVE